MDDLVTNRPQPPEGPGITRAEHPALWAAVDQVAGLVGAPAPERIVVGPDRAPT